MFRKVVCASVILVLCFGVAVADEFGAIITKVSDGKVTFYKFSFKDGKFEKGDEMTLPVADKVKVVTGKRDKDDPKKVEAGEEIKDGLKNEMFTKIGEKGLGARIITDADNKKITEIRATPFGKKGKGGKDGK